MTLKPKIIVIVGPTASGKTSLSIELAKEYHGEIVSADSRQVYRRLDIGTGKVTREEMGGIPHHLLDLVEPSENYTVADYVRDGRNAITEILSRNKLPIVVGGTFFYIDALLGKSIPPEVAPNEALRATLETHDTETLCTKLEEKDPARALAIDPKNRRRLIRALEIVKALGSVPSIQTNELYDTLKIGIKVSKDELQQNIHNRLVARIEQGMIEEVENLHRDGLSYDKMKDLGIEYTCIAQYLEGTLQYCKMLTLIETKSLQYAKRQMTWLKRDASIHWVTHPEEAQVREMLTTFLSN